MANFEIGNLSALANAYNAAIQLCTAMGSEYTIKVIYVKGKLYLSIIDIKDNNHVLNIKLKCEPKEAQFFISTITNQFIFDNQHISISKFTDITQNDIDKLIKINAADGITSGSDGMFYSNGERIFVHTIENTMFKLKVCLLNGITQEAWKSHYLALRKVNAYNQALNSDSHKTYVKKNESNN